VSAEARKAIEMTWQEYAAWLNSLSEGAGVSVYDALTGEWVHDTVVHLTPKTLRTTARSYGRHDWRRGSACGAGFGERVIRPLRGAP
jgi:hypothetical protein